MYYWKVKFEGYSIELSVYANNAKECDLLVRAWLKKQGKSELKYKKGDSYVPKKDTPSDIIDQEYNHLGAYIECYENTKPQFTIK